MSPHVRSPVQIQTPVAVPDGTHFKATGTAGNPASMLSMGGRQVGRRRIFVQIDTGNVCGIELDRADKVESVKKKVQEALCVPTDQSALVFGDHILEKDLSEVRHDSPLLLTRGLRRSSSTPCLSPTVRDRESCPPQPFEIMGSRRFLSSSIKRLMRETVKAIECGVQPQLASGGLGGAYYFRNRNGECAAIVKPNDEEPFAPNNPKGYVGKQLGVPGLKRSIRVGDTGVREVAAYLLDHGHFANVPATMMVKASHPIFNVNTDPSNVCLEAVPVAKICSFQQYAQHDYDASEHGTSRFPVSQVHRIGILDIRILNTDRHAGNILVKKLGGDETLGRLRSFADESVSLIPIDHGLCLPETFEDPYFEWLHWPQASVPFSEEELEYIAELNPYKDAELLRKELPSLKESALQILVICTLLLKRGAAAGLTLAEIGGMMSRGISGMDEEDSELENVCLMAYEMLEEESAPTSYCDGDSVEDEQSADSEQQFVFDDFNEYCEPWGYEGSDRLSPFPSPGQFGAGFRSPVSVIGGVNGGFHYSFAASPLASPMSPRVVSHHHRKGGPGIPGIPLILENLMEAVDEDVDYPTSPVCTPHSRARKTPSPPPWEQISAPSASLSGGGYLSRCMGSAQRSTSLNYAKNGERGAARGTASAHEMTRKTADTAELPEMSGKAWSRFLELYEDLLPQAFEKNKVEKESRLTTRLGTSCQF